MRRTPHAAAVGLAVALLVSACSGSDRQDVLDDGRPPTDGLGGSPGADGGDALLPEDDVQSGATLLVSTIEANPQQLGLRVLDLDAGTSTDLELDREGHGPVAVDAERIWFVGPERTLQAVSWIGEPLVDGSGTVPEGEPGDLIALDDAIVMLVRGEGAEDGAIATFELNGELRCTVAALGSPFVLVVGDELWDAEGRRIDHRTCDVVGPTPEGWSSGVPQDHAGQDLVAEAEGRLVRYALSGPTPAEAASQGLGEGFVTGLLLEGDDVWATVGPQLRRYDARTLEPKGEEELFDCGDGAQPAAVAGGRLWIPNDCDGILTEVHVDSGQVAATHPFPHDGASDSELGWEVVDDGIWFVDVEQDGVPYFFSYERGRFERLPEELRADDVYALDFAVRPTSS